MSAWASLHLKHSSKRDAVVLSAKNYIPAYWWLLIAAGDAACLAAATHVHTASKVLRIRTRDAYAGLAQVARCTTSPWGEAFVAPLRYWLPEMARCSWLHLKLHEAAATHDEPPCPAHAAAKLLTAQQLLSEPCDAALQAWARDHEWSGELRADALTARRLCGGNPPPETAREGLMVHLMGWPVYDEAAVPPLRAWVDEDPPGPPLHSSYDEGERLRDWCETHGIKFDAAKRDKGWLIGMLALAAKHRSATILSYVLTHLHGSGAILSLPDAPELAPLCVAAIDALGDGVISAAASPA